MYEQSVSRTRAVAIKTLRPTLEILKERGGEARGRDVVAELENRLTFNEWESAITPKGYAKWKVPFSFYMIDMTKAGFVLKKSGTWYLTDEGDKALRHSNEDLFRVVVNEYRKWRESNPKSETSKPAQEEVSEEAATESDEFAIEEMEERAYSGIEDFINSKNPYEFQNLCAALLRAMGYYTPFVAPKGRDGGIDIIAYRDPLGTVAPRIRVQVKHRESAATGPEVSQLQGILRRDDVGIFISSGGFTSDARSTARNANSHIELIDMERFISLWQEFYTKLPDEDKVLLPLTPIYFLAPSE